MEYIRKYIEACATFGWNGGPEFSTRIVMLANGRERRNAEWAQYRSRYELPYQNIDADIYRNIRRMFEVVRGQLGVFLYSDPLANYADNQLIGLGDGTEDTFQLSTLSELSGVTYQRQVYAIPDDETIVVTVNGAPTVDFIVDKDRGILIFDTPPANGAVIRWTGAFDVWVRFNHDWLPMSIDNKGEDGFLINGTITLQEMPPPEEVTS